MASVDVGTKVPQLALRRGWAVPDVVPVAVTGGNAVISAGHWVAKHHFPRRQSEVIVDPEAIPDAGRDCAFLDDATPADVAGVHGLGPGRQPRANCRVQPVGSDQQVGASLRAVVEVRDDFSTVPCEASEVSARMIVRRREPILQRAIDARPGAHHVTPGEPVYRVAGWI